MNSTFPTPVQPSLNYFLTHKEGLEHNLRHLILTLAKSCKYISYALQTSDTGLAGSTNQFGEDQVKMDVISDRLLREALCENDLACCYISEEQPEQVDVGEGDYTVVFDPLDGSSLVDANFAIGTIIGIYKGDGVIGKTPREQVAAMYVLYGPRTLLVYTAGNGTHEFILDDVGEFNLLREHIKVDPDAKNYSPGNLRAVTDNTNYKALMNYWLDNTYTMRYSGCMVADIHHIFTKGQGIFTNIGGNKYPNGKLRLLFEVGPFAMLMEQAGGVCSNGTINTLDETIVEIDQRTQAIIGSKNEVNNAIEMLN